MDPCFKLIDNMNQSPILHLCDIRSMSWCIESRARARNKYNRSFGVYATNDERFTTTKDDSNRKTGPRDLHSVVDGVKWKHLNTVELLHTGTHDGPCL